VIGAAIFVASLCPVTFEDRPLRVITPESVKRAVVASIAPQADLAGWSHVLDVNPGRTLLVLLADGSQITGAFVKADAAVLTLKVAKGERDIPQASVKEVRIQTKHIRSGTIAAIAMIAAGAVISRPVFAYSGIVGGWSRTAAARRPSSAEDMCGVPTSRAGSREYCRTTCWHRTFELRSVNISSGR